MTKCPRCNKRPRRRAGDTCDECRNVDRRVTPLEPPPTKFIRPIEGKKFIITAAQNATDVHEPFFLALKVAAKHLGAELIVIPMRYKNPTSRPEAARNGSENWWDVPEQYLFNGRKKLNPNLVLVGDVKIQPTASSPLTGFESLTGAESCILGHSKMQQRVIPVPSGRYPKILSTTGVCTRRNYSDSKAGKIGAFHHFLGALVVEIEGKRFWLRQLNADHADGSFIDLDKRYTVDGIRDAPPPLGLIMGDTHARFADPKVDAATFGPGGIVETLSPETLVWHDVTDGYATNPHHRGNPFIAAAKYNARFGNIREEIEHTVEFVRARTAGRKSVIVSANHDNFLARWVIDTDWRQNPANAAFYLETAQAMLASTKMTGGGAEYADPFRYWVERLRGDSAIRCLGMDESFKLSNIECGMHGHLGPDGARGTVKNLSRLGTKTITGHGHSPEIEEGHYRVGTSTPLRLEYTRGPSSWLNSHCVVYANGKRSLIHIIDGAWRAP